MARKSQKYRRYDEFDPIIRTALSSEGMSDRLAPWIHAMILQESGGGEENFRGVTPADTSYGAMHITEPTARGLGYGGPMADLISNPQAAIGLGVKYAKEAFGAARGDLGLASAYYNAGPRGIKEGQITNPMAAIHSGKVMKFLSGLTPSAFAAEADDTSAVQPDMVGPVVSQASELIRALTQSRSSLEGMMGEPSNFEANIPAPASALAQFIPSLMSNMASAVSGNQRYAQNEAASQEGEKQRRAEAMSQVRALQAQEQFSRRQELYQLKLQDLSNQYAAALQLGQTEAASKLLDDRLKWEAKSQKEQETHVTTITQMGRESAQTIAAGQAASSKEIAALQAQTAKDIAAMKDSPTGIPYLDRAIQHMRARQVVVDQTEANAARLKMSLKDYLKKNPQARAEYERNLSLVDQASQRPAVDESAQEYVQRMRVLLPLDKDTDRLTKLVKQYFPNEPIESTTIAAPATKTATRGRGRLAQAFNPANLSYEQRVRARAGLYGKSAGNVPMFPLDLPALMYFGGSDIMKYLFEPQPEK